MLTNMSNTEIFNDLNIVISIIADVEKSKIVLALENTVAIVKTTDDLMAEIEARNAWVEYINSMPESLKQTLKEREIK